MTQHVNEQVKIAVPDVVHRKLALKCLPVVNDDIKELDE